MIKGPETRERWFANQWPISCASALVLFGVSVWGQGGSFSVPAGSNAVHPVQQERRTVVAGTAAVAAAPLKLKARAVGPRFVPSGSSGATANSVGFGSGTIGGTTVSRTLTFSSSSGTLSIAGTVNRDFTVTSSTCTSSGCTVQVTFAPQFPGLRYDAIQATNSSGTVVAETYVYGTGLGPQAGFDLGGVTTYQGFIDGPGGVAIGPDRRGYISDAANGKVFRFDRYSSNGFAFTQLAITAVSSNGVFTPAGVAVDGSNTLYIADQASGSIVTYRETVVGGSTVVSQSTLATPTLNSPTGLAVDGTGALYIADTGGGQIVKVDNQGVSSILLSGLNQPVGIALDSAGSVYFTDAGNGGEIAELPAGGSSTVRLASSLGTPRGIALDPSGRIYFTTGQGIGFILGTTVTPPYSGGTDGPDGIAVGPNGDIYTTQRADGTFSITDRATSNFIVSTTVGGTARGSATVANTGNQPLTLSSLSVSGTAFSINSSSSCTTGGVVSPGAICETNIDFSPTTPGQDTQTLTVTSNSLNGSGSNLFTLYGDAGPTTTTLTVSPASAAVGQSVSFTAAVTDKLGGTLPAGSVRFVDGTTTLGTVALSGSPSSATTGQAVLTTSALTAGSHSVVATYLGSGTLESSSSGAQTVTVVTGSSSTATTLAVSAVSVNAGNPETLTATIQSGTSPGITGTVTFYDQNGALGSGAVSATSTGGTASLTISFLSVGSHQIYALYNGDGTYAPSTSGMQTVTVSRANTSTALALSASTISSGQAETLTATVTGPASPALTGTVTFYQGVPSTGGTALGSTVVTATSTGATASLTVTTLPVGNDPVYASYSGDTNYVGSVAGTQTVMVTAAAAATVTTLAASAASVVYRTPVALTASVTTASGAAVAAGQVVFCDAAAAHCTAELSLATAQLTSGGSAAVRLPAGIVGTHGFVAMFLGTSAYASSTSGSRQVVVTSGGPYATTTVLASTGSAGSYGLTATVTGYLTRASAPGGAVAFNDTTSGTTLGTANLGAAALGFQAAQPSGSPFSVGQGPYGVAAGDFNGDGYADIVLENYNSNSVSVLLGMGNGGFQPQVTYAVGSLPERVLAADFNGDGYLDLVVANTGSGTLSVLLGNGDGTFRPQVTYAAGSPVGLGVMDLNHDGFPDIVAGDYYQNTVSVLLGRGDGTFRTAVTYATGNTPQTLAEGDFNGDGNVDLAVGNLGNNNVGIFLGNGDGTFQAQVTYAVGSAPQGVQAGDFNADGIDDLAVVNSGSNTVSVLRGNGDGTFQTQVTYPVGATPVGVVIADFNGDGFQDISVGNTGSGSLKQSILLGNGDGTFQTDAEYATGNFPYGEAVADFNGDGFPDLAVSNFRDGTATILLSQVTQTATASISGVSAGAPAGSHTVTAAYAGDANFSGSTSPSIALTSGTSTPAATTASLTISPASQMVGQPVLFSVTVGTGSSTTAATGTVALMNGASSPATVLGTITLGSNGSGSLRLSTLPVGTYSVVAVYGGDANYAASTSGAQALTVTTIATSTGLSVSSASINVGQPETLTATITGGGSPSPSGTVTFVDQNGTLGTGSVTSTSTGGVAMLTLASLSVGTHRIAAIYGGDANYTGSSSSVQSVVVSQVTQTITFPAIGSHTATDTSFALGASASSGLAITYALVSGPATLSGSTVTITGAGTVTIQASQAGNTTYAAATPVTLSFAVTLAAQTITFPAIPDHTMGDAAFLLSATASSGLAVSYAVVSGPATISGSSVAVSGAGTVVIRASQPGNAFYTAATPVTQSFAVTALPTVTLTGITPALGLVGTSATTITLTGTNFATRDAVQLNGTAIESTFVNATTMTATLPASFLAAAGTGQVMVLDPLSGVTTGAVTYTVLARAASSFTGPASSTSGQQPTLTFQLVNPYPFAITATFTLTFAPSVSAGVNDPAVQFASGGRTFTLSIPANSTITQTLPIQTGTVAGTATITLNLVANGLDITPATGAGPVVIAIPSAAPSLTSATLTRSGNSLSVVVHGFSNTREVVSAAFHFTPAAGASIKNEDVTVNSATNFSTWYGSTTSAQYGSSFTYTQQFTLDRDASTVGSVTITLTNTVGSSISVSAQ